MGKTLGSNELRKLDLNVTSDVTGIIEYAV